MRRIVILSIPDSHDYLDTQRKASEMISIVEGATLLMIISINSLSFLSVLLYSTPISVLEL